MKMSQAYPSFSFSTDAAAGTSISYFSKLSAHYQISDCLMGEMMFLA
jgi:hypothetical protein